MAHRHRARHSCFIKNENNCQLWKNTICPFVPFHESNECGLRKKVPSVWLSASGAELCCYGLVFACQDCLHLENPAPQNFHFKKARLGCGVVCLLRSLKWHMDAVAGLCMARHFAPTGSVHCGEETFWRNWPTENVPVVLFFSFIFESTAPTVYAAAWTPRRGAQRGEGKDQQIQTDGRGWCWWARDQTRHEMITSQASKVKHTGAWGKWRHRQGRAAVSPPWPNRTNRVVKVIGMAASSNSSLSGSSLSSGKS